MTPGDFVEIDFGKSEPLDEVDLEMAYAPEARLQIEVLSDRGRWVPLTDASEIIPLDLPSGVRRAATREMKVRGVGYLLVNDTDFLADDMRKYPVYWGITELTSVPGIHLYQID
jgi:hypothetical protein